jgi:peptidoglycan LD-endopeptidase LytH
MRRISATWIGVILAVIFVAAGLLITTPDPEPVSAPTTEIEGKTSAEDTLAKIVAQDTSKPAAHVTTPPPRQSGLIIPVAGVKPDELQDTYTDARSQGRTHNAIDIMAPRGTPVIAATAGILKRKFTSEKGGLTIYQFSADSSTVYYYAHLDRYADGVEEGMMLKQGDVIGYVGDTGNATPGNYHLHFAVWRIKDSKNFWTGEDLNPYILLRY